LFGSKFSLSKEPELYKICFIKLNILLISRAQASPSSVLAYLNFLEPSIVALATLAFTYYLLLLAMRYNSIKLRA